MGCEVEPPAPAPAVTEEAVESASGSRGLFITGTGLSPHTTRSVTQTRQHIPSDVHCVSLEAKIEKNVPRSTCRNVLIKLHAHVGQFGDDRLKPQHHSALFRCRNDERRLVHNSIMHDAQCDNSDGCDTVRKAHLRLQGRRERPSQRFLSPVEEPPLTPLPVGRPTRLA